ncbi:HD-GYP domain-containing protein [Salidesulfovibrio onnuriiensis]|uniref:HD-GYP domain-containing protein n=1 Tax=Salidesulfovibrio onnuriiensis TaxID=2583823 RepID=UPI0011CBC157|nr:HD domain-containing phosphohydrolase [Salidesulfovibrio onnuriiensis]
MTSLKKVIRPGLMRHFLNRAHRLVGEESAVAILVDGEVAVAVGTEDLSGFSPGSPGVFLMDLEVGEGPVGQLALRVADPETADPEQASRLLDFMAFTLQGFMDMETARRSIADEALAKYRELALLHRSVSQFNTSLRLRDVVRSLLNECKRSDFPGEMGAVFLNDPASGRFRLTDHYGFPDLHNLDQVRETPLFREIAAKCKGDIVNDLSQDPRWGASVAGLRSLLVAPIASPNRCEGILLLGSRKAGVYQSIHQKSLSTMASVAGISVSNAFNFEGARTLMDSILQALAEAIDSRDPFTAGHSRRVAQLAVAFALVMNGDNLAFPEVHFSESDIREIYYAGILHDVGKIGIREEVLTKDTRLPAKLIEVIKARLELFGHTTGFEWQETFDRLVEVNKAMTPSEEQLEFIRGIQEQACNINGTKIPLLHEDECDSLLLPYGNLTHEERLEIQRHPAESERILHHIPMRDGYRNMLTIIRQHHERLDGSGYPDGLKGPDILLQSRMMAIVDVYDAITQERHYKPAASREEALHILSMDSKAGKLDSTLVDFFTDNVQRIEQVADTISLHNQSSISQIEQLAMH